MQEILTLSVGVAIVLAFVSLNLVPIIHIGTLGIRLEILHLIIHRLGILFMVTLLSRRWSSSQIVHNIYILNISTYMLQYNPIPVLIYAISFGISLAYLLVVDFTSIMFLPLQKILILQALLFKQFFSSFSTIFSKVHSPDEPPTIGRNILSVTHH